MNDKTLRACTKCKIERTIEVGFVKDAKSPTGLKTICKICDQHYRDQMKLQKQKEKALYGY
jgi:hypothetical protein